jgi:hypothetical protein
MERGGYLNQPLQERPIRLLRFQPTVRTIGFIALGFSKPASK